MWWVFCNVWSMNNFTIHSSPKPAYSILHTGPYYLQSKPVCTVQLVFSEAYDNSVKLTIRLPALSKFRTFSGVSENGYSKLYSNDFNWNYEITLLDL